MNMIHPCRIRPFLSHISFLALLSLTVCGPVKGGPNFADPEGSDRPSADEAKNERSAPTIDRAIEVVQRPSGVYLYRYAETIEAIDPKKDYTKKYRIFKPSVIDDLRKLIAENRDYSPEFKARCLPVWDAGLEFREKEESVMFLFSFRCNTIRYVEGNLFKDFTPQRTAFYKIFEYQIGDDSAVLLENEEKR